MDQHDAMAKTIARYFDEVWNRGDVDALDDLLTADYVNHSPGMPGTPPGPAGLKPIVRAMRTAIPDLHYTILDLVTGHDKAAVYVRVSGTQEGALFGLPATGKPFVVDQMQFEWFKGNRISQHWRLTDELALLRQLRANAPDAPAV